MYDEYTDWGDSFDDMDGGDWEYHMGGPDYEESELWEKQMESDDDYDSDYGDSSNNHDDDYGDDSEEPPIDNNEPCYYEEQKAEEVKIVTESEITDKNSSEERQIEIIRWLVSSQFTKTLKGADGFFILSGHQIQLNDGRTVDMLDWLLEQGARESKVLCGYNVVYTKPGGKYFEKLTFFKVLDPKERETQNLTRQSINFTRKIKILNRLSKSKFAVKFKKGEGFFVYRGNLVELRDGTKTELLDWLAKEGIKDGNALCGYSIRFSKPDEPYFQKLAFFKVS
ncbi:MAG: hypothetical protein HQK73_06745 [Desulfamplus sp.]|nr:hypothetical protein [Desulfamplus sp.]